MEHTIDNIETNEGSLKKLIAKQTSILDATINLIKRDETHINKQFKSIEKAIDDLSEQYKRNSAQFEDFHFLQLFNSLSIHASMIIINYQQIQKALLDLILNANHGKISPLLLSTKQIDKELQVIREFLPSDTTLPVAPGEKDYSALFKLLTARGRITRTKALFEIGIPLLNTERFDLYRMVSLPIPVGQSQTFIQLSAEYLGVNLHRDKFLVLNSQEFTLCQTIISGKYLCNEKQPLATKSVNKNSCETCFNL